MTTGSLTEYIRSTLTDILERKTDLQQEQITDVVDSLDATLKTNYGGCRMYVRTISGKLKSQRDEAIVNQWLSGVERPKVAERFNVGVSTVHRAVQDYLAKREGK